MKAEDRHIILPPLIGLIVALTFLFIVDQVLIEYYFPVDSDPVFEFSFFDYLVIYLVAFTIALIIAIPFQLFIANRIWNNFKKGTKFLGLKLWQLIAFSCPVFGFFIAAWSWNSIFGIENFILRFSIATIIAIIYWIVNIYTLKVIEEKIKVQ